MIFAVTWSVCRRSDIFNLHPYWWHFLQTCKFFCILIISKMQIVNGFVLTENWLAFRQIHIKLKKWVVTMIFGCEHFLSFFLFYYFWYGYNYLNTVTFLESQNVLLHQIAMFRKMVSLVSCLLKHCSHINKGEVIKLRK